MSNAEFLPIVEASFKAGIYGEHGIAAVCVNCGRPTVKVDIDDDPRAMFGTYIYVLAFDCCISKTQQAVETIIAEYEAINKSNKA